MRSKGHARGAARPSRSDEDSRRRTNQPISPGEAGVGTLDGQNETQIQKGDILPPVFSVNRRYSQKGENKDALAQPLQRPNAS